MSQKLGVSTSLMGRPIRMMMMWQQVERFIRFQHELEELGKFVEMLPFDENATESGDNETHTGHHHHHVAHNDTTGGSASHGTDQPQVSSGSFCRLFIIIIIMIAFI